MLTKSVYVRWGLIAAALGSVFPVACLLAYAANPTFLFPEWGVYLWPSSLFMMAIESCRGVTGCRELALALSLIANALMYYVLGVAARAAWPPGTATSGS